MSVRPRIREATAQSYERLRNLIVRGELGPGDRIIELDFARRFGVSRTPLREALLLLQREGYVIASNGGQQARLSVAPLTRDDARDAYHLLGEIAGLAAARAAELDKPARQVLVRFLRKLNMQLEKAASAAEPDRALLFELDEAFHLKIVRASGARRLIAAHDVAQPQTERYERLYVDKLAKRLPESVREHEAIAHAIEQGAADAAHAAARANWRNAAARLGAVLDDLSAAHVIDADRATSGGERTGRRRRPSPLPAAR